MIDVWLLLLVFLAIAIGWYLGRRSIIVDVSNAHNSQQPYYKGLNYLLNNHDDGSLDSFIEALDVTVETFETHIAVGNLMRRKGEVLKAIRIHQNLLSRPSLPTELLHEAHLELAKDFISAGLLDRAERLLEELLAESPKLHNIAIRHLLEILQDEKEWQRAIEIARQLMPKRTLLKSQSTDPLILRSLSHYCCELAEQALRKNDFHKARLLLKQAFQYDHDCARASLLFAQCEYQTGHYSRAIKCLHDIRNQNISFVPESISLLKICCEKLNKPALFQSYLLSCLDQLSSVSIVLALVDDIQQQQGVDAAIRFIYQELKRNPSLLAVNRLLQLQIDTAIEPYKNNLINIQLTLNQLLEHNPQYKCNHCGFSGKLLHWLCPSCKSWGEVTPICSVNSASMLTHQNF